VVAVSLIFEIWDKVFRKHVVGYERNTNVCPKNILTFRTFLNRISGRGYLNVLSYLICSDNRDHRQAAFAILRLILQAFERCSRDIFNPNSNERLQIKLLDLLQSSEVEGGESEAYGLFSLAERWIFRGETEVGMWQKFAKAEKDNKQYLQRLGEAIKDYWRPERMETERSGWRLPIIVRLYIISPFVGIEFKDSKESPYGMFRGALATRMNAVVIAGIVSKKSSDNRSRILLDEIIECFKFVRNVAGKKIGYTSRIKGVDEMFMEAAHFLKVVVFDKCEDALRRLWQKNENSGKWRQVEQIKAFLRIDGINEFLKECAKHVRETLKKPTKKEEH
jgi:hypothetical protein